MPGTKIGKTVRYIGYTHPIKFDSGVCHILVEGKLEDGKEGLANHGMWRLSSAELRARGQLVRNGQVHRKFAGAYDVSPLQVSAPCALPARWVCTSLTKSSFQQEIFPYIPLDMILTRAPGHTFMGVASNLLDVIYATYERGTTPPPWVLPHDARKKVADRVKAMTVLKNFGRLPRPPETRSAWTMEDWAHFVCMYSRDCFDGLLPPAMRQIWTDFVAASTHYLYWLPDSKDDWVEDGGGLSIERQQGGEAAWRVAVGLEALYEQHKGSNTPFPPSVFTAKLFWFVTEFARSEEDRGPVALDFEGWGERMVAVGKKATKFHTTSKPGEVASRALMRQAAVRHATALPPRPPHFRRTSDARQLSVQEGDWNWRRQDLQ